MDKSAVRSFLKEKRRQISFKKRNAKSLKIIENLHTLIKDYDNVAIYMSLKDEVNTSDYLDYFLSNYKVVSSSKIEEENLVFYQISSKNEVKPGYMDILEPKSLNKVDKKDIEAIIVPMLGFDKHLNRMGYGKGFYDRYLKDFEGVKIGLAFDVLNYPHLPHDENDVSLDYVVSEKQIYKK